jgi:hypothetical protein
MSFIAGQYVPTYASGSTGQIKDGIRIDHVMFKRKIRGDNYADSDQDAVWRGTNVFSQFTLLEYNAAQAAALFWPYGNTYLTMGVIGRLDSALSAALVLTALTGTPAAVAAAPASITMSHCILAEGYPVSLLYAPDLREVPIRLQAYPYIPSSVTVFGTLT